MQVSKIENSQYNSVFKSAVPVFVKVSNAPVVGEELNSTFMRKTEYLLNNTLKRGIDPNRDALVDRMRRFVKQWIPDFYGKVAAFTCVDGEMKDGTVKPYFYFLTGDTINSLEKLRLAHKDALVISQGYNTANIKIAKDDYYTKGKNLVQRVFREYHPFGKDPHAMIVSYEPIRNKRGIIKDYKLTNVEFQPVADSKNPTIQLDKLQ